jgi:hypothetical protein
MLTLLQVRKLRKIAKRQIRNEKKLKLYLFTFRLDTDKKTKRTKKKKNINQTMENGKTTTYAQSTTIY